MAQPRQYYQRLSRHFGPQHWWPARSRWEIMVGAVLTQNTAWRNVEKALAQLRRQGLLRRRAMLASTPAELGAAIRSAGFWRQKERYLRALAGWVEASAGGRLERLFARPTAALRTELLALPGVGPETADAVLLYAGGHARFVVDAYTERLLRRHGEPVATARDGYGAMQAWFETGLGGDVRRLQEMHALIVAVGQAYCHKTAGRCRDCPLADLLPGRTPAWAAAAGA